MADDSTATADNPLAALIDMQGEAMREMWGQFAPGAAALPAVKDCGEVAEWAETAQQLQAMWFEFIGEKAAESAAGPIPLDPAQWMLMMQGWAGAKPFDFSASQKLAE
jgi:polyhydroxyalkanoate synthase subunit PhaC